MLVADDLASVLRLASETAERLIPRIDRIYASSPSAAAEIRRDVQSLQLQLSNALVKNFASYARSSPSDAVAKLKAASDDLDKLMSSAATLAEVADGASDFIAATTAMMAALPGNPTTDPVRIRPKPIASGR
jgi:hypothetical protein